MAHLEAVLEIGGQLGVGRDGLALTPVFHPHEESAKLTEMDERLYRICTPEAWAIAQELGELPLAELDRRDGYVHLSRAGQIAGTLARHFAGREGLLLLTIACERLIGELRHEPVGPSGELFPHLHGSSGPGRVPLAAIIEVDSLPLDEAGRHQLPVALTQSDLR